MPKKTQLTATYERESKRFRRFLIDENDLGIVGNIYVPKDKDTPEVAEVSFKGE